MEPKIVIPSVFVPLDEKKPIYKKKVKEHRNTYVIRRQYRHIETIMWYNEDSKPSAVIGSGFLSGHD